MFFTANTNRKQVVLANPQAVKIVKVCGGYAVFDCIYAYETWKKQK